MKYAKINEAIINNMEVPDFVEKNGSFYDYLLKNNVAYYYSKKISKNQTERELEIIAKGDRLNHKFEKTLKLINQICNKHNVDFALHKTYKHVEEAVDGDIDCVIKEKDFHRFLDLLQKEGFKCEEDGLLKGCCEKKGYLKIEPRSTVSFHGLAFLSEDSVWENTETVNISGIEIKTTSQKFDALCLLFNCLYGPKYMRLYLRLLAKDFSLEDFGEILGNAGFVDDRFTKDLNFIFENLVENSSKKKHPVFFGGFMFLTWWLKRILFNRIFPLEKKLRHLVFFYYSKYKYMFFNKLHFEHRWDV